MKRCVLKGKRGLLFIGAKEDENPTSNRCGIANLSKKQQMALMVLDFPNLAEFLHFLHLLLFTNSSRISFGQHPRPI